MKAFAQLITFATVILAVTANPAQTSGEDALLGSSGLFGREVALRDAALNFINWLKANPKIVNQKPLCFYSGRTQLKGPQGPPTKVFTLIPEFQKKTECNIILNLLKQVPASFEDRGKWGHEEWTEVSKTVAQLVNKDIVHVILGEAVKKTSVWEVTEKPELKKRRKDGAVKKIQMWTLNPDSSFTQTGELPEN